MARYRLVASTLLVALLALIALPAAAVSDEEGEDVVSEEEVVSDYTPAVVVDTSEAGEIEQPWTTRFLVPTGLLIAGLALFGTAVQYFTKVVRARYKVVE